MKVGKCGMGAKVLHELLGDRKYRANVQSFGGKYAGFVPGHFLHRMAPRLPRQRQRCMGVPRLEVSHREGGCSGTRPPSLRADMLLNGANGNRREYAGMNGTGTRPLCRRPSSCRRTPRGGVGEWTRWVREGGSSLLPPVPAAEAAFRFQGWLGGAGMPLRPCGGGRGGVTCSAD
jgi:hypothetical protein